jgi:hypothetical protein
VDCSEARTEGHECKLDEAGVRDLDFDLSSRRRIARPDAIPYTRVDPHHWKEVIDGTPVRAVTIGTG